MANDEVIGPRKTMFVLVIVVGCFAVLWPRILSPLVLGPTREQIQPNQFDREAALKQERAPPMRGMGPHPALRERGRAIPPGPPGPPPPPAARPVTLPPHIRVRSPLSVYYENEQPPPIPGMRPPLGSPGGPVPAPKSSMGFVMPIYTICIIVFFVYTLTKILFRRQAAPYDPVPPDPQFRRRVFRDDSRSSPEKLGKKEADAIVTAISGLVAEVQQQMEASGAPNQQRQDVQDNARPYTNGTILLNSGPVQIVTSEYKEISKEKTLEPDNESTTESKKAEHPKVVKEITSELYEPITYPKESSPEGMNWSPEPELLPQENKTTLETVVLTQSSLEPAVTKPCTESSAEKNETTPEPIQKLPVTLSESELIENFSLESTPIANFKEFTLKSEETILHPEVIQDFDHKSELSELTKESIEAAITAVSKETSSDIEELTPELNKSVSETIEPIIEPKEVSAESILEHTETVTTIEITPEPKEFLPGPIEAMIEPLLEPEEPTPDYTEISDPILHPYKPSPEPEESIKPKESSLEPKELLIDIKESLLEPQIPSTEIKEPSVEFTEPLTEIKERTVGSKQLPTEMEEPPIGAVTSTLDELNDTLLESEDPNLQHIELSVESKELISKPIEPPPKSAELVFVSRSTSNIIENSSALDNEFEIPQSEESVSEGTTIHLGDSGTKCDEPIPNQDEPLLSPKPIPECNELFYKPTDSEFNADIPTIDESAHVSDVIIPEHNSVIDQSISDHKESNTCKEPTPDLIDHTQEVKVSNIEFSPDSTGHTPELQSPTVECRPKSALIEYSPEVVAPDIEHKSEISTELLQLKEPTPQSKETTPDPELSTKPDVIQTEENTSVPEETLLDLEEAIADVDEPIEKYLEEESEDHKTILKNHDEIVHDAGEELLKACEGTDTVNDVKDDIAKSNDKFLEEERFVVVQRSSPDMIEENKKLSPYHSKSEDNKLYTESDEEDLENAAVKVVGMEMTAHPVDGSEWPRDERPPPPVSPAPPTPRAPHAAEDVKSIFLETEIPQQSRVLVAQFQEDRPAPAKHAPLVVSGKMTLSLIQDAPRETPERDPESTLDEFTTASAVTQPAAEKGEIESDEEIDEEIEVEEIELEEEEESEEEEEQPPPTTKPIVKK